MLYWPSVARGQGAPHIVAGEFRELGHALAWLKGALSGMAVMETEERAAYRVEIFEAESEEYVLREWVERDEVRDWSPAVSVPV